MRKLALALLLLAASVGAAFAQGVQCTRVTTGTAATQIATADAAGRTTYVCGYTIDATGASAAFTLAYGTGSNCGTNTTAISPAFSATGTGAAFVDHQATAYVFLPPGTNLCVTVSTNTSWAVYWQQQQ